jgi:hypothetical protein
MRNEAVMDQLIPFHKPNTKKMSEKIMDHPISQTNGAQLENGDGNRELLIRECLPSFSHG